MPKFVLTNRQVIADKLLVALNDESKVAVVLSKEDCEMLEEVLEAFARITCPSHATKCRKFAADLTELRTKAFGK